jgi:hypothetical protein
MRSILITVTIQPHARLCFHPHFFQELPQVVNRNVSEAPVRFRFLRLDVR